MKKRDQDSGAPPRSGDRQSHERITVIHSAESRSPMALFDHLFVAAMSAPLEEGERAVVDYFASEIATLVPTRAVGICLVPAGTENAGPPSAQYIAARRPAERLAFSGTKDPTRVFPEYVHERVLLVEEAGTTLHLASDEAFTESSELDRILERSCMALGHALAQARAHIRARASEQELSQLSRHIIQSEKLASLGQLAAGVVHELHNPLTSIIAYTEYLSRKAKARTDSEDDLERLARIAESAKRLQRFTRDLVTYARPSREEPVFVSLNSVADQALAFCEHVLESANLSVERRYAPELPTIEGRPEQLTQVFVNLVTNAAHALEGRGGRLVITTLVDGANARVEVEDDGAGISAEHIRSVFTPFFTTKREGEGSGLGLSIVKNIVDMHEGTVWAEHGDHGSGARIVMLYPLARRRE